MSIITVDDLSADRTLDREAMSLIKGASAPWVYGWCVPFKPESPAFGPVVNFYQINNSYFANQMINQYQSIDVSNSGANSSLSVVPVMVSTPQTS